MVTPSKDHSLMPASSRGRVFVAAVRAFFLRARALWRSQAWFLLVVSAFFFLSSARAQAPGISSEESTPNFQLKVQRNVVFVRVVVRDSSGKVVEGLKKEDFRLLDNRRPQVISSFEVETAPLAPAPAVAPAPQAAPPEEEMDLSAKAPSMRYLGLFFDDLNMKFQDLAAVRQAADRFLERRVQVNDRLAIFTSSGVGNLEFTSDLGKLHEAILKIHPSDRVNVRADCPEISDYMADRIVNYDDSEATDIAVNEAIVRCRIPPLSASQQVQMDAERVLNLAEFQTHAALDSLETDVRRMSTLPGQRLMLLVTPGFLPLGLRSMVGEIADRAVRANVVVSAVDPKGLISNLRIADASRDYLPTGGSTLVPNYAAAVQNLDDVRELEAADIMKELAEATGGTFTHNTNDLDSGIIKGLAAPEVSYVLTFSPSNLKFNGVLHNLKVELIGKRGLSIQARRGYFAPKQLQDPAQQAKEDIQRAAFSQDEWHEIPVEVQTQFFKTSDTAAEVSVIVHVDAQAMQFQKEGSLNVDNLSIVGILLDRDGNVVLGKQKDLSLRFDDAALARLRASGVKVRMRIPATAGSFIVRLVVRDGQSGQLSAVSKPLEIPL